MTIWDAIRAELPALQVEAEAGMVETVRIDRVLGNMVDSDGNVSPELLVPPVYEGRAKITSYQPYETERDVSGSQVVQQRYIVQIPVSVVGVRVGDVVTVLADGRVFRVGGTHRKSWQTSQRLLCDETTGGLVS